MNTLVTVEQEDLRVMEILRGLTSGSTREELSENYSYSNWKSLDIYMRRKGYSWDSEKKTYNKSETKVDKLLDVVRASAPSKVTLVMGLFKKENPDPKSIAKQAGFRDHIELAAYMQSKGYIWSSEEGNYVQQRGKIEIEPALEAQPANLKVLKLLKSTTTEPKEEMEMLQKYLPILEVLERNWDRLLDLLSAASESGTVPHYAVPGAPRTKSVYMSELLASVVGQFCESRNLSQKQVFEAAIIEFLRRYGYGREIEEMLRQV